MRVCFPKITVVTVVKNAESTIEKTINSVLCQDYPNTEYIVIDGNSQDRTKTIIQKHINSIQKYVSESDRGIYYAMNKAASLASGDWIIYMNAGDVFYETGSISRLSTSLESDADVIFAGVEKVLCDEIETRRFHHMPEPIQGIWKGMPASHQATLVRSDIQRTYGFDTAYVWCADHDLIARLYRDGKKFVNERFLFCIFDCTGGRARDPKVFIKERWQLSKGLAPYPKRFVYYGLEWIHCAVWGPCVSLLKKPLSHSVISRLRKLRGTGGLAG